MLIAKLPVPIRVPVTHNNPVVRLYSLGVEIDDSEGETNLAISVTKVLGRCSAVCCDVRGR